MKLQLDRPPVQALAAQFPALETGLQDQLRFGHRIELHARTLPIDALEFLARLYADAGAARRNCAAWWRRCATKPIASRPVSRWRPCCPRWCATQSTELKCEVD